MFRPITAASTAAAKIIFGVFCTAVSIAPPSTRCQSDKHRRRVILLSLRERGAGNRRFSSPTGKPLIAQENNCQNNSGLGIVPVLFYTLWHEHTVNIPWTLHSQTRRPPPLLPRRVPRRIPWRVTAPR